MDNFFNQLTSKALRNNASILIPETSDKRIRDAIIELKQIVISIPDLSGRNRSQFKNQILPCSVLILQEFRR